MSESAGLRVRPTARRLRELGQGWHFSEPQFPVCKIKVVVPPSLGYCENEMKQDMEIPTTGPRCSPHTHTHHHQIPRIVTEGRGLSEGFFPSKPAAL